MSKTNIWSGTFSDRDLATAREALVTQLTWQIDKTSAKEAAVHLYDVLREPEPQVLWLPSPVACAKETAAQSRVPWETDYKRNAFHKRPLAYANRAERRALARMVRESIRSDWRITEALWWYRSASALNSSWNASLTHVSAQEIGAVFQRNTHARNLRFAIAKCAIQPMSEKAKEKTKAWRDLYVTAHFAFLRKGVVALSAPPVLTKRDAEGRFHSEYGPAIRYKDGVRLWIWHGVVVPKQLIQFPDKIDIWDINGERNAEVRRVMMERYGMDRYLHNSRARRINAGKLGVLYRVDYPDDTFAQFVVVKNSTPEKNGSFKEYVLQVRPGILRADDAVAWTFGFSNAEKYKRALAQET